MSYLTRKSIGNYSLLKNNKKLFQCQVEAISYWWFIFCVGVLNFALSFLVHYHLFLFINFFIYLFIYLCIYLFIYFHLQYFIFTLSVFDIPVFASRLWSTWDLSHIRDIAPDVHLYQVVR